MTVEDTRMNRRRLVGSLGLAGAGAAAIAAIPAAMRGGDASAAGGRNANMPAASMQDEMTWEEMNAGMEAGVKAFPAATAGKGNQPAEFEMDGDVKVFNLTVDEIVWEYSPGKTVDAFGYNGMIPGPVIRVTEGDKCRFNVTNNLKNESHAVHWHGVRLPYTQDGVPYITQPPINPGETFTYEFTIKDGNAGSHMYHSHMNAAEQTPKGLLGAFIIEPKDESLKVKADVEYIMILNDGPIGGYSLNGKGFPATEPIVCTVGQTVHIRYMNEGMMIHPMHLHGFPQQVIAYDGNTLEHPHYEDTINVAPGQRVDVLVVPDEPGVWAFHCHILNHAELKTGMFGMTTALVVQEAEAPAAEASPSA